MFVDIAHTELGWPTRDQILNPKGAGPSIYAQLVREKIGRALSRREDVRGLDIGILASNPDLDTTEAPLAIVCEFHNRVSDETLKEAHSLAWNFSRAPLLITIEPQLLRAWTCCEPPQDTDLLDTIGAEIVDVRVEFSEFSLVHQAARSLHWVQFVTGQFFREHHGRFDRNQRADQMLLSNLKYIREKLHNLDLSYDCIHDLLARVIFIQFLFQRKDSTGQPALNDSILKKLHEERVLSETFHSLGEILAHYDDAYRFFKWLNDRFSGDLFPGQGATPEEREAEWRAEMRQVKPQHLSQLADFVSGRIQMERGQLFLWERYSFDAIPLEFISSIYEVFVGRDSSGVYYTPGFVVDFMLDAVLPWDTIDWDVKILDPACGSGIFLVKAFQRLVHRWRKANDGNEPPARVLRQLLENNLFGVDIDPHAVRVASFSLYLALCDEVDPRHYWRQVRFPRLREKQIVHSDFFYQDKPLFREHPQSPKYHIIVGNAPWGRKTMTRAAEVWAQENGWSTPYQDIGPLFLPKAVSLCHSDGQLVMLQPAGSLLHNQVSTAKKLRRKLFAEYKVDEVVNLSALRFGLFKQAISPTCIVTMRSSPPDGQPLLYTCPKSTNTSEDDYRIVIEPHDTHFIYPQEAASDALVWAALIWGGRRDLAFIRELSRYPSIAKLRDKRLAKTREGVIRGDRGSVQKTILKRPLLEQENLPISNSLYLNATELPLNEDPCTDSAASTDFSAFDLPQMIIKQGWQTQRGRFQAAIVKSHHELGGVICSQSYISVHVDPSLLPQLEAACLSYNSKVAVYYLLLTSGRFASYRPELLVNEMLAVPIPDHRKGLLRDIGSADDVDARINDVFEFKDSEWALVEDLFRYTLADFKVGESSPGRLPTRRQTPKGNQEPDLRDYCESFLRVLKAGFGENKAVCATIFHDDPAGRNTPGNPNGLLPVRMIAIHLDWPDRAVVNLESVLDSLDLWQKLQALNRHIGTQDASIGLQYQRVARVYETVQQEGRTIPTVYLIKPDQLRYWTRSVAMRDADDVAADIMIWRDATAPASGNGRERKLA